jgi:hypothetical protein
MELGAVLKSKQGEIIVSVILGFGLATLFRKVCKGNTCIVVKGPKISEVDKFYYKVDEKCYKYTPYVAPCQDATPEPVAA